MKKKKITLFIVALSLLCLQYTFSQTSENFESHSVPSHPEGTNGWVIPTSYAYEPGIILPTIGRGGSKALLLRYERESLESTTITKYETNTWHFSPKSSNLVRISFWLKINRESETGDRSSTVEIGNKNEVDFPMSFRNGELFYYGGSSTGLTFPYNTWFKVNVYYNFLKNEIYASILGSSTKKYAINSYGFIDYFSLSSGVGSDLKGYVIIDNIIVSSTSQNEAQEQQKMSINNGMKTPKNSYAKLKKNILSKNEFLEINFKNLKENYKVTIYNIMTGKLVKTIESKQSGEVRNNISDLPKGFYSVIVNGKQKEKLIITD